MNLKESIIEIAHGLGFQRTVIASVQPMTERRRYFEEWLARGQAAGMEYLKRNPEFRTSPALLFPSSRSAIVVSASYYTAVPPDPGPLFGRVARYAVGLDYHAVLRARLRALKSEIEKCAGRPLLGKAYTDDVALYEQGIAANHGLGFRGRHTLIIGPKLAGTFNFVAELFTDLDLEPDEPYEGTCGKCFRCGQGCPTDAIGFETGIDSNKCISYLTIENKGGIPVELRSKVGRWIFGCDVCQEVCPYNQRPPEALWDEFQPDRGAGHFLSIRRILEIQSEEQFRREFAHTPLRRPKLRGMKRNALVVAGNALRASSFPTESLDDLLRTVSVIARDDADAMLKEHALWALDC